MHTLLALCRVSNLPTVWMNVLTAVVLTVSAHGQPLPVYTVLLLALALSAFYCGGMSLNDLCDRRWDAEHQPFRPIPAGYVTVRQASAVTLCLFVAAFVLLAFAPNVRGVWAAVILLTVIVLYDCYHKRHRLTVLLMASARLLVYVVSAAAIDGSLMAAVWIAGSLQFFYTLLITMVARYENLRGTRYSFPLIPRMIAGMAVLDGIVLAILVSPLWLVAGLMAALLTRFGQRYVRGD